MSALGSTGLTTSILMTSISDASSMQSIRSCG